MLKWTTHQIKYISYAIQTNLTSIKHGQTAAAYSSHRATPAALSDQRLRSYSIREILRRGSV